LGIRAPRWIPIGLAFSLLAVLGPSAGASGAGATAPPAWVQVSVATVWYQPSSPRPIDWAALGDPARIEVWLGRLSVAERLGLDSRIKTQVLFGGKVLVEGHRGEWSLIEVPNQRGSEYPRGITGWVPSIQLSGVAPPVGRRQVIVGVPRAWLHVAVDGTVGVRRFLLSYDTELPVVGSAPGYVIVGLPGGESGAISASAVRPVHQGAVSGSAIADEAHRFLGIAYLWGGTSAFGYDCSGLVYSLFARFGRILPRDTRDQWRAGRRVALAGLRPGDLLFFAGPGGVGRIHHVAVYVGRGLMIDAPYTGASIGMIPITSSPLWDEFAGAVRVATER
jgi:gamma-D-glutamyl-L-lysine dipeptidyl-peptidase